MEQPIRPAILTVACSILLALLAPINAISGTSSSQPSLLWKVSRAVFGPHARTAYCIAKFESHWNPQAVSAGGGNWGAWQINVVHRGWIGRDWARILDPWVNARVAYRISHGGRDWSAWTTHGFCGV